MTANATGFCDTNIFVYAYDVTAGEKRYRAKRLVERLWEDGTGVISIQILQELFVTLTKKVSPPLAPADARVIVSDLTTWQIIEPTSQDILEAIDASLRWQLSFWDAMILTAAKKAGATILWSEDLNDDQAYDQIVVRNPFH